MDKRVVRADKSKEKIKKAFMELFQTKEPDEISVVELCKKAKVNRSTFYAHYEYMDNLIREVLWEGVVRVFEGYGTQWDLPLEDGGVSRSAIREYLRRFLSEPTVRRFCTCGKSENYRALIIKAHVDLTVGPSSDPFMYHKAYFHNAGALDFLLEWLNSGSPIPESDVVEIIHQFSKVMYSAEK